MYAAHLLTDRSIERASSNSWPPNPKTQRGFYLFFLQSNGQYLIFQAWKEPYQFHIL